MAQLFVVHPVDPQVRLLRQAAQILDHGGVGAIPTDSCYALVCHLDDKAAVDRIRAIRRIDFRRLSNSAMRFLRCSQERENALEKTSGARGPWMARAA